jgi:hypothetical protein
MQMSQVRILACFVLIVPAALAACGDVEPAPDARPALQWYTTCGDPACGGYSPTPGATLCSSEQAGQACGQADARCEIPNDDCNADLLCTDGDPAINCPISRQRFKHAIRYLDTGDRQAAAAAVLELPLATYRYRGVRDDGRQHLGFVIDDLPAGSPAVHADGQHVDLYGYTSMAVAALQAQAERVQALEAQMAALQAELAALRQAPSCPAAAGQAP